MSKLLTNTAIFVVTFIIAILIGRSFVAIGRTIEMVWCNWRDRKALSAAQ